MFSWLKKMVSLIVLVSLMSSLMAVSIIAAKIGVPENLRWEGTKACWDEVEDAYQYQVLLYKDGVKTNSTINSSSNSVELSGRMKEKGKYTFQVRVRERISDEYGRYSSSDSGTYIQEKTIKSTRNTKRTTSTRSSSTSSGERNPGPGVAGQNWKEDNNGWWYDRGEGSYPKGEWFQVEQKWYYFDENGYLLVGWITVDGKEYYCYSDGDRAAGWSEIDGGYYYFDVNGVYNPDI